MPVPSGFVVKNGTNRLAVSDSPGALVVHAQLECVPSTIRQSIHTRPFGLERGVGGIAHEVDEQLIQLVAVGLQRHRRAHPTDLHRHARLERGHAAHPVASRRAGPGTGLGSRASRA